MNPVDPPPGSSLETRPSLLHRLKSGDDPASWEDFYRLYGRLIHSFAIKAGLTHEEADEVVQETAIGVARRLPDFVYDPKVCRFKTWLLNLSRWRISNQIRKRGRLAQVPWNDGVSGGAAYRSTADDTDALHQIPDPSVPEFGTEWDAAWETHLLARALERVRETLNDRQFQVFDLYVTKGWAAADVARTLQISAARVYLIKHRVSALLSKEIKRLEREAERALRRPD